MNRNNQFKPMKQMSEANVSANQPSIVSLKLPSQRIVNVSKFSFKEDVTNMLSSNNSKKQDVKSCDDKKRSRSPSMEEEDDGADDSSEDLPKGNIPEFSQDEQTVKDLCSTYSMHTIFYSEDEANRCCFDYSRRLHEEPPWRSSRPRQ